MAFGDNVFGLADPNTMALLGALSGVSQFAGASRLPQTFGQALGGMAGGALGGLHAGQQYQLGQQEQLERSINNANALDQLRMWQAVYNAPMPSRQQILSGEWQGTPESVLRQFYSQIGGGGAPNAAPEIPQPGQGAVPSGQGSQLPQVPNATAPLRGNPAAGTVSNTLGKLGYSPTDQAAVLGNAAWESQLNPANASGDSGTSVGLWQWHSPERKAGLMQYAQATGRDWSDPSVQAEYMDRELRQRAPEFFDPDKSLAEKTKIFQDKFEVPKEDTSQQRLRLAQNFAGGTVADATAGSPQAQGGTPTWPGLPQMMANVRLKAMMKMSMTPAESSIFAALQYPWGSPMNRMMLTQAWKAAGVEPVQNIRQGGGLGVLNPFSGQYETGMQRPRLPLGAMQGPNNEIYMPQGAEQAISAAAGAEAGGKLPAELAQKGRQLGPQGLAPLPGAIPTEEAESTARAAGPPTFEPQTYTDIYGRAFLGTRRQLPNIGNFGVGMPPVGPSPGGAPAAAPPPAAAAPSAAAPPPAATAPAPAQRPEAGAPIPTRPESAPPTFAVNTALGQQKDISQVTIDDMFPGGAGIPRLPAPPGGLGYAPQGTSGGELQKDNNEQLIGYSKEASENQKVYQDLAHLKEVLQRGLSTGKLLPLVADMANIAHSLGRDDIIPKGWSPVDADVFQKAGTDLIFAAVKKLAGQVKVAEIQGYAQASPNKTLTPEANFQIINDLLSAGKWQDARAKLASEFITQYPNTPMATFNNEYNRMAPLADVTDRYKQAVIDLLPPEAQNAVKFPGQTSNLPQDKRFWAQHPVNKDWMYFNGQDWVSAPKPPPWTTQQAPAR